VHERLRRRRERRRSCDQGKPKTHKKKRTIHRGSLEGKRLQNQEVGCVGRRVRNPKGHYAIVRERGREGIMMKRT